MHSDQWMFLQNLYLINQESRTPKPTEAVNYNENTSALGAQFRCPWKVRDGWHSHTSIWLGESHYHLSWTTLTLAYTWTGSGFGPKRTERTLIMQINVQSLRTLVNWSQKLRLSAGVCPLLGVNHSFCSCYAKGWLKKVTEDHVVWTNHSSIAWYIANRHLDYLWNQ